MSPTTRQINNSVVQFTSNNNTKFEIRNCHSFARGPFRELGSFCVDSNLCHVLLVPGTLPTHFLWGLCPALDVEIEFVASAYWKCLRIFLSCSRLIFKILFDSLVFLFYFFCVVGVFVVQWVNEVSSSARAAQERWLTLCWEWVDNFIAHQWVQW